MSQRRPYMTRDDGQRRQQALARYLLLLRKMAETLGRLPLWTSVEGLERLRQLRLDKREWLDPCYPATLTTPKTRQRGANR